MTSEQEAYDELRCYTLGLHDPQFVHQHAVDAFTAQNADGHTRPIALTFALVGLYLLAERQFSGRQVQRVHMELAKKKRAWPEFALPASRGQIRVTDVVSAPPGLERDAAIHRWCASVWQAFHASHGPVAELLQQRGIV